MKAAPPRWADRLLELFLEPHLLEDVQGDLYEVFSRRVGEVEPGRARREYALAALNYLSPFFLRRKPKYELQASQPLLSLTMLRNYLKIAFRTLAHNKAYSIINVVGLSIGLGAAMLILLYTKDEVSYDRFHRNTDQIYRIVLRTYTAAGVPEGQGGNTGAVQGPKFKAGVPDIRSFVRYREHRNDLKLGNEIVSQSVFYADTSFFNLFSFPLIHGNPVTALQKPQSVVLSEEMAAKAFGTTDALGKILFLKDSYNSESPFKPYTVTAVARKAPQNSSIKFDIVMPYYDKEGNNDETDWFSTFQNTFVLLRPGSDLRAVEARMNRVYQADAREQMKMVAEKYGLTQKRVYALQPLTDMHLNPDLPADNGLVDNSNPMFSYILSGIALFILLIACINFVNLTIARSLKRAKEIGVRKVVGGGRSQLILQFLGESYLLSFGAFALALVLVQLVLPTFNQVSNKALALSYLFDFRLVTAYLSLFFLTGLLAGFYPALVLSGFNPVETLYSRFRFSGKNYLQKSLVVLQFSLASFLIIATLTVTSQFNYLTSKDLGYDDRNLITVVKSNLTRPEAKLLREQLVNNPAIAGMAAKNQGRWGTVAKINGETQIEFTYETVDEAYLPMLKIPILKGRNFSPDFPSDSSQSVIVNESFVKKAGWKNPIGQQVNFWYNNNEKYRIIGVVKDYHFLPLNEEIRPQLFTMRPGNSFGMAYIKIKPGTETASLNHIEAVYKKLFPINPYAYKFKDEDNRQSYEAVEKWRQIMLFGAVLTIFISAIGLFGLATLSAERRFKEIGIRKVLGASVSSIVRLLSSDFLKLVGGSFVLAFPVAWYALNRWLENFPYRIDQSAWTFLGAAGIALLIALFTVSFQAVRAAVSNPVKSLKAE
ncbi:ABC transporter permease [Larkinella soli]|uniref:ABC transporter permease n=1 Tax=Larkinella soli TaxID=1770527 RepID=UPI000FFB5EE9|nr:ABC transporter permease [Larkinella soli]